MMRFWILVLLSSLFLPISACTKKSESKKASQFTLEQDADVVFERAVNLLTTQGYEFENLSSSKFQIKTYQRQIPTSEFETMVTIPWDNLMLSDARMKMDIKIKSLGKDQSEISIAPEFEGYFKKDWKTQGKSSDRWLRVESNGSAESDFYAQLQ